MSAVCSVSLTGWQTLGVIGCLISLFIIAIFYMLSELTANAGLKAWAKVEIGQVVLSIIILGSISAILLPLCSLTVNDIFSGGELGSTGLSNGNFFDTATQYVGFIRDQSFSLFSSSRDKLGEFNQKSTIYESECSGFILFCLFGFAQPINRYPYSGLMTEAAPVSMAMNSGLISTLTSIFILFVLAFINNGVFQVLLPLGVMMRSLPFLRGFGGALIAISLSMFIFYPFMLVVDAIIFMPSYAGLPFVDPFLTKAAALFIAAIFLPALNFVIIGAFTRELAQLFGADIDISKLSQMI